MKIILIIQIIFSRVLIGMTGRMIVLCDETISLIDAKTLKASLIGKEYFETVECKAIDLRIQLNHIRINVYKSILRL